MLVYTERRLIEPRLTGARLSALTQAALVYTAIRNEITLCASEVKYPTQGVNV